MVNHIRKDSSIKKHFSVNKWSSYLILVLISLYICLFFFEAYINFLIGPTLRYLMIIIIFLSIIFKKLFFKIESIFYILWLGFRLISILWSTNSNFYTGNVDDMFSLMLMVSFLIVMTSSSFKENEIKTLLNVMQYSSFILAILNILFAKPYFGIESRQVLMINGYQIDPNNMSSLLIFCFSIALYSFFFEKKKLIQYVMLIVILFVSALSIFMTGSRTGLILIAGNIVFIIFYKTIKNKNYFLIPFLLIISLIGFQLVAAYIELPSFDRLLDFSSYLDGSGRLELWNTAFAAFKNNYMFGYGWGGFTTGIHNTYLSILIETGIIGFTLFATPIFIIIYKSIIFDKPFVFMLIASAIIPSLTLDILNKRFFWTGIIISCIVLEKQNEVKYENFILF